MWTGLSNWPTHFTWQSSEPLLGPGHQPCWRLRLHQPWPMLPLDKVFVRDEPRFFFTRQSKATLWKCNHSGLIKTWTQSSCSLDPSTVEDVMKRTMHWLWTVWQKIHALKMLFLVSACSYVSWPQSGSRPPGSCSWWFYHNGNFNIVSVHLSILSVWKGLW